MDYQHVRYVSEQYDQNNLECLILNMIHQEIQIDHSMLEQRF